ncbi:MAG: BrnA antitoxin family protein [Sulfuricella sp.]
MPTPEEADAINAGIAADPNTYELTDEEFAHLKPMRGRPASANPKVHTGLRLDAEVLAAFKSGGAGLADAHQRGVERVAQDPFGGLKRDAPDSISFHPGYDCAPSDGVSGHSPVKHVAWMKRSAIRERPESSGSHEARQPGCFHIEGRRRPTSRPSVFGADQAISKIGS